MRKKIEKEIKNASKIIEFNSKDLNNPKKLNNFRFLTLFRSFFKKF